MKHVACRHITPVKSRLAENHVSTLLHLLATAPVNCFPKDYPTKGDLGSPGGDDNAERKSSHVICWHNLGLSGIGSPGSAATAATK